MDAESCSEGKDEWEVRRRFDVVLEVFFEGRLRFLLAEVSVALEGLALDLDLPGRGGENAGLERFGGGILRSRRRAVGRKSC